MSKFFRGKKSNSGESKKDDEKPASSSKHYSIYGAKKFMASQLMNSSTGRKQVIKLVGTSGDAILSSLFACVEIAEGRKFAKSFSIDVMKFITKIGLMFQNKTLTQHAMTPLSPYISEILYTLVNTLQLDLKYPSSNHQQDSSDHLNHILHNFRHISANLNQFHDALIPLIQNHMREKNHARFTRTIQCLTSASFMKCVFLNEGNALNPKNRALIYKYKRHVLSHLKESMNTSVNNRRETDRFLHNETQKRRDLLEKMVETPSFSLFKRHEKSRKALVDWASKRESSSGDGNVLHSLDFVFAVDEFKKISSRNLLHQRAGNVLQKYLATTSRQRVKCVDAAKVANIDEKIDLENVRKNLFDDCLKEVEQFISHQFQADFLHSKIYQDMRHQLDALNDDLNIENDRIANMVDAMDEMSFGEQDDFVYHDDSDEEEEEEKEGGSLKTPR